MIIDVHGHLGNINFAPFWAADGAKLEVHAQNADVDIICISSARAIMYDTAAGNRELDETLRDFSRLRGYVTVNPMFPESLADLSLLEQNDKFIGVKVHPDYHGYDLDSSSAREFLDEAARQTRLMLFHVSCMPGKSFARPESVLRFAEKHPQTTIIMAHMAGIYQNPAYPYFPNFEGMELVRKYNLDNVLVDTAHYLSYVYPGVMERMVELLGAGRVAYGTDVPLQGSLQMKFLIQTIRALPISDEEKDRILYKNISAYL
jgi:predicted TIM-barrel fold metal-dependent hydrolase